MEVAVREIAVHVQAAFNKESEVVEMIDAEVITTLAEIDAEFA